jgi:AraC-like DNA-binding protein
MASLMQGAARQSGNGTAADYWHSLTEIAHQDIPPDGCQRMLRNYPKGLGPLVEGDGSWLLIRSSNLLASLTDITLDRDMIDHVVADDFVMFEFALDGGAHFAAADGDLAHHDGFKCTVIAPSGEQVTRRFEARSGRIRRVGVGMPISDLICDFGLNRDGHAETFRRLFPVKGRSAKAISYSLTREEINAVHALLDCPLSGGLRERFLAAKLTELICLSLARLCGPTTMLSATERALRSIEAAADLLESGSQGRSVLALPRHVGLNRNKINSGFRERYGMTPGEFAREARLQQARQLIIETKLSMYEIAESAGFGSQASLSRAYRARFDISPREDRQRQGAG